MPSTVLTPDSDASAQAKVAFRHEINNLLFVIVGSAESALKRVQRGAQDADATLADLQRILQSAERVQQAVADFTRPDPSSESVSEATP
jgi:hypothetical protein